MHSTDLQKNMILLISHIAISFSLIHVGEILPLFVAGWGVTDQDCITNEKGPVNSLKCSFPFEYGGEEYYDCTMERSPSSKNKDCKQIKRYTNYIHDKRGQGIYV